MIDSADHLYERVLVLRCQVRDEAAFAEMIERYQARLRFYICKMLNDSHIAEDVLQEVWWDMFRGISRLKQPGAFRVWLYRIARDRTVRELRRRRIAFSLPADLELIRQPISIGKRSYRRIWNWFVRCSTLCPWRTVTFWFCDTSKTCPMRKSRPSLVVPLEPFDRGCILRGGH